MKTLQILFCSILFFQLNAQTRVITARILDSQSNRPVKNAAISAINSTDTIFSNHLGFFQKAITDEDRLVVSHDGYVTNEFLIPEQNSFAVLLDRHYANLGYLVLNKEPGKMVFSMDSEVRHIDSAIVYKGNWQTLFSDLNDRIVHSVEYPDESDGFTFEILFTVTHQGKIEDVSVIDAFLPKSDSVKENIKRVMESIGGWPSLKVPEHTQFFRIKITNQDEVYSVVEESAMPVKGMSSFYQYVSENLRYPIDARKYGIEGRVFVEFIVEENGELTNARILKGIGFGCDEEALRIIKNSPKWIPGRQRGKPVRQRYVIPLGFKLTALKRR